MVRMVEIKIDHNDYLEPEKENEVILMMENLNTILTKTRGATLTNH